MLTEQKVMTADKLTADALQCRKKTYIYISTYWAGICELLRKSYYVDVNVGPLTRPSIFDFPADILVSITLLIIYIYANKNSLKVQSVKKILGKKELICLTHNCYDETWSFKEQVQRRGGTIRLRMCRYIVVRILSTAEAFSEMAFSL